MMVRSRTLLCVLTAYAISMVFAAQSFPSYDSEAGRKYDIALQRVADLKKSKKRQKYRSYWMDCIRTFEQVEKKYPRSSRAGDACVERAGLYVDLYGVSKASRDLNESIKVYTSCQRNHASHARAPEALYRMLVVHVDYRKDREAAKKVLNSLQQQYPDSAWTDRALTRLGVAVAQVKNEAVLKRPPDMQIRAEPAAVPASGERGMVTGIRHWASDAYTRIVVDLDTPLQRFESHELREPDRLVFDLHGMRIEESLHKESLELNNGMLRQVRSSQYAPDTVRVVLDLASIKSYAAFPLHDPERLVIDVTGNGTGAESHQAGDGSAGAAVNGDMVVIPPVRPPGVAPGTGDALSLSRQLGLKVMTIAIDAGHGGHDPGAIGKSGLREKHITLDIAKRLEKLVKDQLDCKVIMTRDKDIFIPLEERPFIAKSKGADLFVSIHVNANRKRRARGIETYIQSITASDRDAMETAARENAMSTKKLSELKSELDRIFADLARDDKIEESLYLAHAVQDSLVDGVKPVQRQVVNLGVKRAFFYVLIKTDMPSILAEVGFISNPDEEHMLKKASYRQKIAESLLEGIKEYIDARSPKVAGM